MTAWVRSLALSFERMLFRFLTVGSVIFRLEAMILLELPFATPRSTSSSRVVIESSAACSAICCAISGGIRLRLCCEPALNRFH